MPSDAGSIPAISTIFKRKPGPQGSGFSFSLIEDLDLAPRISAVAYVPWHFGHGCKARVGSIKHKLQPDAEHESNRRTAYQLRGN